MSEPTTAAERREMREEARAADRVAEEPMALRGGKRGPLWIEDARGIEVLLAPQEFGACVRHSYAARPSRLLALLDEHEAQAAEIERLRARDASMVSACNEIAEAIGDVKRQMDFDEEATIHDVFDSFRSTASELHEALGALKAILAEQAADRSAAKALAKSLPRCSFCLDPTAPAELGGTSAGADVFFCREHANEWAHEVEWAAPLRALQARMATWGEAGAEKATAAHEDDRRTPSTRGGRVPEKVTPGARDVNAGAPAGEDLRWAAALEREAAEREGHSPEFAWRVRAALAIGVRSERDDRLVLAALGWSNPDAVERALRGEEDRGPISLGPCVPASLLEDDGSVQSVIDDASARAEAEVRRRAIGPSGLPFQPPALSSPPPEPDDEQSAYDAEVAERMGR